MWLNSFSILIIWAIIEVFLYVDCFPTKNDVKENTPENIEILNNLDDNDSAELYGGQFQGDMILSSEQIQAISGIGNKTFMLGKKYKWPGGIVPFRIDESHFNRGQIDYIHQATKKIESVSCIKFVPYVPYIHEDYLDVKGDLPGCFSAVGCQKNGSQRFNVQRTYKLNKGCFILFTIVHELLHSLGFHHMQSASDRDEYVRINEDNIKVGFKPNFDNYPDNLITHYGVEYDYGSVMHYSNTAFSFDHRSLTIEPLRDLKGEIMGQRNHMTEKDILRLNRAYCNHTIATSTTPSNEVMTPNSGRQVLTASTVSSIIIWKILLAVKFSKLLSGTCLFV